MLKRITIDNFKSLKHLEYDCAGLNLLTGMNGAGKSSFIQMLRLMGKASGVVAKPHAIISGREFDTSFSYDDFHCCYAKEHEIKFSVSFALNEDPFTQYDLRRIIIEGTTNHPGDLVIEHPNWDRAYLDSHTPYYSVEEKYATEMDAGILTERQDEEISIAASRAADDFLLEEERMRKEEAPATTAFACLWKGMRYVDAFRRKPTDVHTGGKYSNLSMIFGWLTDSPFGAEGQDVAEYIYKSKRCQDSNTMLDRINAALEWVSPGAKLYVEGMDVAGQEYLIESVGFGKATAERKYKPQNVGFGISYILPVLVALFTAEPGRILIIENPEAHLHPRGQSEMGKLIAETVARGVQVFVETHSDHVINGIRVAVKKGIVKPEDVNIAFFERGPHDVPQADGTTRREIYSEVTNIKVDANGSLSEWPKDFMDEWGIQQMKLLRP